MTGQVEGVGVPRRVSERLSHFHGEKMVMIGTYMI